MGQREIECNKLRQISSDRVLFLDCDVAALVVKLLCILSYVFWSWSSHYGGPCRDISQGFMMIILR